MLKNCLSTLSTSKSLCTFIASICFIASVSVSSVHAQDFKATYEDYLTAVDNNDFESALPLAQKALIMGEAKFAKGSENALNLRFNVANMLVKNRQFSEAYEQYQQVEEGLEALFGKDSSQVFDVRLSMYFAGTKSGPQRRGSATPDYSKKAQSLGRRLVKQAKALAEEQPELAANYYYQVISTLQKAGKSVMKMRRMASFAEDTEGLLIAKYGESDLRVLETRYYLGKLYKSDRKFNTASEKLESVVSIIDDAIDYTHPWELSAHAQLVDIYETIGKSEKATEHCLAIGQMTPWDDNLIEPTPLFRVDPKYPMSYARARKNGSVKIKFDISEYGFVINPEVIDIKGGERFAESSLEALKQWRYAPKFVDGQVQIAEARYVQLDFFIGS